MAGALDGFRVLDCTQYIGASQATALLAEMAADVVKVEPLGGEPWRLYKELAPKESRVFQYRNRGKRSIAVDLRAPGAEEVRERLIGWADVIVTNYSIGTPEKLGIDYVSAKAIKPDIIYCDVTNYGKQGPRARQPVNDVVLQAGAGLMASNQGTGGYGLPQMVAFQPLESVAALVLAWAVTAALLHRERTGEGQEITTSLLQAAMYLQSPSTHEITNLDTRPRAHRLAVLAAARERGASIEETYDDLNRANYEDAAADGDLSRGPARTDLRPGNIYNRAFRTKDGFVAVGNLVDERHRDRYRTALGMTDPRAEAGFDPSTLAEVNARLVPEVEALYRARTTVDVITALEEHGVPCAQVRTADELWDDVQVAANGYLVDYEHPVLGPIRGAAPLVAMSASPTRVQRAAPTLGQDNDTLLAGLGFDTEAIERLRHDKIVR